MKFKDKLVITERGWAGHFCCSSQCRFVRNTLIQYGNKRQIVSTVGKYVPLPPFNSTRKYDQIGYNRWYETMAFEAELQNGYWDADVSKQIDFNSEWEILGESWEDVVAQYPTPDNTANDMHDAVVKELSEKIKCPYRSVIR